MLLLQSLQRISHLYFMYTPLTLVELGCLLGFWIVILLFAYSTENDYVQLIGIFDIQGQSEQVMEETD